MRLDYANPKYAVNIEQESIIMEYILRYVTIGPDFCSQHI